MFTQAYLDRVHRAGTAAAVKRLPKREMAGGDGLHERSIPFALYANATKVHGVDPGDTEYWRDMDRLYPQYASKHGRRMGVGAQGGGGRMRNRFGGVSLRIVYKERRDGRVERVEIRG